MKRTIRTIPIGLALFIIPIICLPQKKYSLGFIINNDMQRIEGEIGLQSDASNCQSVSFKEGEHAIKYLPSQIKSWGVDNNRLFTSKTLI